MQYLYTTVMRSVTIINQVLRCFGRSCGFSDVRCFHSWLKAIGINSTSLSIHSLLIKDDNFDKTDYDISSLLMSRQLTRLCFVYCVLLKSVVKDFDAFDCTLLEHRRN